MSLHEALKRRRVRSHTGLTSSVDPDITFAEWELTTRSHTENKEFCPTPEVMLLFLGALIEHEIAITRVSTSLRIVRLFCVIVETLANVNTH